jgi:copper chaperone CopZ
MINPFKRKNKNVASYPIVGMHCASCAAMIESELDDAGIKATCSYAKQTVEVPQESQVSGKELQKIVKKAGYDLVLE